MSMNNKGQTLVLFALLLPVLVLILSVVINTGYTYLSKRELENNIKAVVKYRFEIEDDEVIVENKLRDLVYKNIDNINKLDISISDNYVKINAHKKVKLIMPMMINKNGFEITTTYIGYMSDNNLIIEKE